VSGVEEPLGDDACTAVLLSAPREIAERIEAFLSANRIACRIRLNTEMTPERLAEEYVRQSPTASRVLDMPLVGPLLRGRLSEDLRAEIQVIGSEIPPVWDVLVRPEDLAGVPEPASGTTRPTEPLGGALGSEDPLAAGTTAGGTAQAPGSLVVLCELPWDQAWALTERLNAAGIPAAVLQADTDRDRPMDTRVVPIGVRPEDMERARSYL
jgi:hypothetical protein